MKYVLFFSTFFFVCANISLFTMEEEINKIINKGNGDEIADNEYAQKNINQEIVQFVHNVLYIKTDFSKEESDNKGSMERALEHLAQKNPKKYKKIKRIFNNNPTKSKHKDNDANKNALTLAENKIIQLCLSMMEEQNNEDRKNYKQEQRKKWLSFGWGVISTAAVISISLYAALNPVKVICNGTVY